MIRKFFKNANHGQAIVLIALMFVGLVAMVGIMVDGGTLMLDYARLKRGVDAAAVGAAQQFKQGYQQSDLTSTAQEFMQMNQSNATNIQTDTCTTKPTDAVLCALPLRKLVRVTATQTVDFGFLRILGINSTDISASAVGESASIDMVLVIDTSISMAAETSGGATTIDPGDDPSLCNYPPNPPCEPMATVKSVAHQFALKMFFPYDRVSIIALTKIGRAHV
jgi:Flp pilus assembly protein TadG